jgi:hypothetical protein
MAHLMERLTSAFDREGVRYGLVGGYAVALHGAPRGTIDVDCIIRHTEADFEACERALRTIGLEPRLPLTAKEVFKFRDEYIQRRNLIAWSFVNPTNPVEVVDIIITHDLAAHKTVAKRYLLGKIHVLALDDLIQMKKASGRPQDLEDVKTLEALREKKI